MRHDKSKKVKTAKFWNLLFHYVKVEISPLRLAMCSVKQQHSLAADRRDRLENRSIHRGGWLSLIKEGLRRKDAGWND